MNDLEEFENWHKDLMVWEHFQDELERISGENISDNSQKYLCTQKLSRNLV